MKGENSTSGPQHTSPMKRRLPSPLFPTSSRLYPSSSPCLVGYEPLFPWLPSLRRGWLSLSPLRLLGKYRRCSMAYRGGFPPPTFIFTCLCSQRLWSTAYYISTYIDTHRVLETRNSTATPVVSNLRSEPYDWR